MYIITAQGATDVTVATFLCQDETSLHASQCSNTHFSTKVSSKYTAVFRCLRMYWYGEIWISEIYGISTYIQYCSSYKIR